MSLDFEHTSTDLTHIEITPVSPNDIPFMSDTLAEYEHDFDTEDVVEATIVDEAEQPIDEFLSTKEVTANIAHDAEVRRRYGDVETLLTEILANAKDTREKVVGAAIKDIEQTEADFTDKLAEMIKARDIAIAGIWEQFNRTAERAGFKKMADIQDNVNVIERADDLLDDNEKSFNGLKTEMKHANRIQDAHEKRRDAAVESIKRLAIEKQEKEAERNKAQDDLDGYYLDLAKKEELQDSLIDEANAIRIEEIQERKKVSANDPDIQDLVLAGIDLDSDENSDDIKAIVKAAREKVTSAELSRLKREMIRVAGNQDKNDKDVADIEAMIKERQNKIKKLTEELALIPGLIETQQAILNYELGERTRDLDRHSTNLAQTTQVLRAINEGDTTSVAREEVPLRGFIEPVWNRMGDYQLALEQGIDAESHREWPTLNVNDSILLPLLEVVEDDGTTVEDLTQTINDREKVQLAVGDIASRNIFGIVPRGLSKKGAAVTYQLDNN